MTGIYKITCLPTREVYIGQSTAISRRWATHKRELKKGIHYNIHLQRTYNKYGEENFVYEILEQCPATKLNEREKFYIKLYDSFNNGFNQDIGGSDISGENNPMFGIKGKDAPRFIDYILQLDSNGKEVGRYESTIEAAESINGGTSPIIKCLNFWRGKEYDGRKHFTYKGFQWIYEQDYQILKSYHDFSKKQTSKEYITLLKVNEGALSSNT